MQSKRQQLQLAVSVTTYRRRRAGRGTKKYRPTTSAQSVTRDKQRIRAMPGRCKHSHARSDGVRDGGNGRLLQQKQQQGQDTEWRNNVHHSGEPTRAETVQIIKKCIRMDYFPFTIFFWNRL